MKNIYFLLFLSVAGIGQINAQKTPEGSFEFSLLSNQLVDQSSFGFGIGIDRNWHESFQIGVQLQSVFHRNRATFGYGVGSPFYSGTSLLITNAAQLFRLGRWSLQANANAGWLFISLQDENFQEFNPLFGFFEPETIATETYRLVQGGLTLNFTISQKGDLDILLFVRALHNQAFGNVRFGGVEAQSGMQFNLGVKVLVF